MADNIFLQISVLFGITVSIALIMRLLRQPLVVAYIVSGLIAGPLFLNLVKGGQDFFQMFAKFGIVLLLFIVGLSLNFDYIKKIGRSVLVGGILQFVISVFFGFLILVVLRFSLISSVFIAIAVSFSSTIIVSKLLTDKKDSEAFYGRYVIGVLLLQDILAIIILIFLNTVNLQSETWQVAALMMVAKGLLLVGGVFLMSRYLLPVIIGKIASSGELLFIFTIAWCFGVASLVYWAGFNIEIGAIIAGISLGASVYQPEISSRIRPLRDFFIVLFFVVLGSELQLSDVGPVIVPAVILSAFILIVDPLVLYFIMRFLKYTRRTSFLASVTSAQVSEFGFILVFTAKELGYLHGSALTVLTLVALITIIISSYLITYNERLYSAVMPFFKLFGRDKVQQIPSDEEEIYDAWVFGYHRIGWKVCAALAEKKVKFAVVDFSPEVIARLKNRGIPAYFGDAADIEFLELLPLESAKIVISTIPSPDDQKTLIRHIRSINKKIYIIASLYHSIYLKQLYQAGADYVIVPHLLGGNWIANILKKHAWEKRTFRELRDEQQEEMRQRSISGVMHL